MRNTPLKAFAKIKTDKVYKDTPKSKNPIKKRVKPGIKTDKVYKDTAKSKSPITKKLKPCQKAAARAKFDVYPSAYANMWAAQHKC